MYGSVPTSIAAGLPVVGGGAVAAHEGVISLAAMWVILLLVTLFALGAAILRLLPKRTH